MWLVYVVFWLNWLVFVVSVAGGLAWQIDVAALVSLPIVWTGVHLTKEISDGEAPWLRAEKGTRPGVPDDDWESAP
jgi:hypothetical protein